MNKTNADANPGPINEPTMIETDLKTKELIHIEPSANHARTLIRKERATV